MVVSQFSHIQRNPHNMRMDVNEKDPQEIHSQLLCGVIMAVVGGGGGVGESTTATCSHTFNCGTNTCERPRQEHQD